MPIWRILLIVLERLQMKRSRLKSVSLVNSGGYSFSNIEIEGNVLLSGANGSGKSTFLRVVLFFYNPSSDRADFGIDANKESFLNFYFPYSSSYMLYEYINQYGRNFVLVYKRKKLRFKFFAIDNNQVMDLESIFLLDRESIEPEGVIANLRKYAVDESDIFVGVRKLQETIYGQHRGKNELKKFALYRATSEYQHIGNTIKNIFLNHKIDADSIKTLLVSNINEIDRPSVQLEIVKDNIDKFLDKQESIEQFIKNIKTSDTIAKSRNAYVRLRADEDRYLSAIVVREEHILKEKLALNRKIDEIIATLNSENGKKEKLEGEFLKESKELAEKSSFLKRDIKEAQGYLEDYHKNNIKDKLERYNQIDTLKLKKRSIEREKEILIGKAEDRVKKFDNEILEQENRKREVENSEIAEINSYEKAFLEREKEFTEEKEKQRGEINQRFETLKEEIKLKEKEQLRVIEIKRDRLSEIRYRDFYKDELEALNSSLESKNRERSESLSQIRVLKEQINSLLTQIEKEESEKNSKIKNTSLISKHKIEKIQDKIDSLDSKINSKSDSFIAFLNNYNISFKNHIFSILKDEILTATNLNPKIVDSSTTLYGVEIDTPMVESLDALKERLNRLKEEKETLIDERDSLISFIESEAKNSIIKIERERGKLYKLESELSKKIPLLDSEIKSIEFEIAEKRERAKEERSKKLKKADSEIAIVKQEIEKYQQKLKEIKAKEQTLIDRIKDKYKGLQKSEEKIKEEKSQEARVKKDREFEVISKAIEDIKRRKDEVLRDEGISQEVLNKLEVSINSLAEEIQKYRSFQEEINRYLYEQKPKIEKLDSWREELERVEGVITDKRERHSETVSILNKSMKGTEKSKSAIEEIVNGYKSELELLAQNIDLKSKMDRVREKKSDLDDLDMSLTIHNYFTNLTGLIREMSDSKDNLIENIGKLFKKIDHPELLNLLPNRDNTIGEFLRIGADIERFLNEKKIDDLIKETISLFKLSTRKLSRDIEDIRRHTATINKQLNKIRRGINDLSGISVIDEIDIRLQDSENQILLDLNRLKEVHDKYGIDYDDTIGEGLFAIFNTPKTKKDKKADMEMMKIFKSLSSHIENHKRDYLSLDECFEIAFKISENGNESRWQNSLNGIGSEGTDIIVKILIYISLLSITKKENIKGEADIHCLVDEIGKLSPLYFKEIIDFTNSLGIYFVNGMPSEMLVSSFKNHYKLRKIVTDKKRTTIATRIIYSID